MGENVDLYAVRYRYMCNRLVNKRSEMELENQSTNNNEYAFKYQPQNVNCAFGKNGSNDRNIYIYEYVRDGKQVNGKSIFFSSKYE